MENLSHSRPPTKSSSSFSKKSCTGTNFTTKTTYDDVFGGGAPTLAPRVEDYAEIFGGFHAPRASSIPVLDLPMVDEDDVFFDVQSSGFDYDEVFAGLDYLDCAVSFQELMMGQSKAFNADVDSSDEAWTLAETDSVSEGSDQSGENLCFSNRDRESTDGSMEFNISYSKVGQRSDADIPNGITHVTEPHAVSGYSFLVDETTALELEVINDSNLHMDGGGRIMRDKNLKKTQGSVGSSSEQAFADGLKPQSALGRNCAMPKETFVTISEISLRTQPSEVPPPGRPAPLFDVKLDRPGNISENCSTTASERRLGDTSPPFYDVEVDASSSAAASAAAMKEVMEKAQAKLKTAKELLDRKREGFQSRKHVKKNKDKEKVGGACERETNGITVSVGEGRQRDVNPLKAVSDLVQEENLFTVDETLAERHGPPGKIVGAGEWKEATEFFELVKTDRCTFEQSNYAEVLGIGAGIQEYEQKCQKEVVEHQRVNGRTMEMKREDSELWLNEKNLMVAKKACQQPESYKKSGEDERTCNHKGDEKRVKVAQGVYNLVEEENKSRTLQHSVETEKKSSGSCIPEKHENLVNVQHRESKFEGKKVMKHQEIEQPPKETNRSMQNETSFQEPYERAANGRRQMGAVEKIENEKVKALEKEGKEKMFMGRQEVNEKRFVEAYEKEESKRKGKEAFEQIERENQRDAYEQGESEKRLKKAFEQESCEKQQIAGPEREDTERRPLQMEERERKQKETCKIEETERRLEEVYDREMIGKRHKEARGKKETKKRLVQMSEQVVNCGSLYEAHGRRVEREMRSKEALEKDEKEASLGPEKRFKDAGEVMDFKEIKKAHEQNQWDGYGKKKKMAEGLPASKDGGDLMLPGNTCMLDDKVNHRDTHLSGQYEENNEKRAITQGTFAYEGNIEIQIFKMEGEIEAEVVDTIDVLDDSKCEVSGMGLSNLQREECILETKDVQEPLSENPSVETMVESGTGIGHDKTMSDLQLESDIKIEVERSTNKCVERENNVNQTQVETGLTWKLDKEKILPTQLVTESAQNGKKMEASPQMVLGGKGTIQKSSQLANASQRLEKREKNINEARASEDKEAERNRRESELEIERLRKIEEEREREREREKDRMAVDLATREAREKPYAEARERAERAAVERATSEVRQRALAEARERLEKACAEAKEKSLAEKVSMEARLRAERAAVERATAEARERAAEKAMAERATFEARERVMDRTFSEKFSASSRNGALRPSSSSSDLQDHKVQSASSISGSRYPYFSGSVASFNAERSDAIEGESAQRSKARLERHRRTADRAAKALAEKNMRDLLAQREQAERNRLAETLDADVRRWSSGKEGNLRALLSTLQYILGPDSGWHPIPLTEVITSAAVKKAYRKATLCVHPDKLQQRGASIQQKYICEKVFDLLKEAWNKFNSEER